MATLRIVFKTDAGRQLTMSLPNTKQDVDPADIRVLVDKIIEHQDTFHEPKPVEFISAELLIINKVVINVP